MKSKKSLFILIGLILIIALYFIISNLFFNKTTINEKLFGKWSGFLKTPKRQLVISADILKSKNGNVNLKISSPKQKQYNIPTDSLVINNNLIMFSINKYKIRYKGIINLDSTKIIGTWYQDNFISELDFYRPDEILRTGHPQYPVKPYPYNNDSVYFFNYIDSINLAGTITYPKKNKQKYPAILLINGLGKHDRDETMYGHKPFLLISDYLTRKGYVVFRADDRGVGKSGGKFEKATTKDFTRDMISALKYLKTKSYVDTNKIGIIGFNEGGLIAARIASESDNVKFIILLSTPGITGKEILLTQTVDIQEKSGIPDNVIQRDLKINKKILNIVGSIKDSALAYNKLRNTYRQFRATLPKEDLVKKKYSIVAFKNQLNFMLTPWFKYYLNYNPKKTFTKIKIPVLIIYGDKDVQVNAAKNNNALRRALEQAGNKNYKSIIFPNLNHLLQHCQTGLPNEYAKISQTVSPAVLDSINVWLNNIKTKL